MKKYSESVIIDRLPQKLIFCGLKDGTSYHMYEWYTNTHSLSVGYASVNGQKSIVKVIVSDCYANTWVLDGETKISGRTMAEVIKEVKSSSQKMDPFYKDAQGRSVQEIIRMIRRK
jgi:hypothetical protein